MKKLIATIFASIFLFSSHLLAADFGFTVGLGVNTHLGYASITEDPDDNRVTGTHQDDGVFVDDAIGGFVELNIGDRISVGLDVLGEDYKTPEAQNKQNGSTNKIQVDFTEIKTVYARIGLIGGSYFKVGTVSGNIETNETMATSSQSGSTVGDQDLEGTTYGFGYALTHDSGLQVRFEGLYADYNTFAVTDSSGDKYTVNKMEGVTASIKVAKAF